MNEIVKMLIAAGFGAAVTGAFTLIKWKLDRNATKEDKEDAAVQLACDQRGKELKDLSASVADLKKASRMQFYSMIKSRCKKYIARGYITSDELEDLIEEHKVYHNELDGNGFLDELMKQAKSLPTKN